MDFSSIKINKLLHAPVYSVSLIKLKLKKQLFLLSQVRCLVKPWLESTIISIDSNITDNIMRKVINALQEKCTTRNRALRNYSIKWIFLWILPIQNHSKPSITEKRQNKTKYLTWNSIKLPTSNSLWYNCQENCSWLRRPKTKQKKATFL